MFRAILYSQWKWSRLIVLLGSIAGFALPIISLQGAARADRKYHVVRLDVFHEAPLHRALRCDVLFAECPGVPGLEYPARRSVRVLRGDADQRFHFCARKRASSARQVVVLLENAHGVFHIVLLAIDGQAFVVQLRAHTQFRFEQTQIFIQRAEKGFDFSGYVNGTSHPSRGVACPNR